MVRILSLDMFSLVEYLSISRSNSYRHILIIPVGIEFMKYNY